jgi:hypothetical protein
MADPGLKINGRFGGHGSIQLAQTAFACFIMKVRAHMVELADTLL